MAEILIVEDDTTINEMVARNLKMVGHKCTQIYDGRKGLEMIEKGGFDLVLLDVMLPGMSGFEVMEKTKDVPVIFVTAKGELDDKLHGLSIGAEDYIVKPFEILELIARINVVLRRTKKNDDVFKISDVEVHLDRHDVFKNGERVQLAPQEYELLEVLIINRNMAMSREKLLELAWGWDYMGDTKTVDVHIRKLRKKLGLEKEICTINKLGYRLETD
ncbi:response regulator transcription factor [Eubacterium sp. MSJ-13]|uniref:response regulator transcription factor n=1 Tax=Eubacterium sp. MSJ-13 TaxID=2841513 RepID=UPI001C11D18D|nr:response regulator transcription factor [Eubacterium sp. MSJ-13]MBU5478542.1 response regulator transcription factor [Eubacterium sp. MSJ-13]